MYDELNKKTENKKLVWAAVAFVAILLVIVLVNIFVGNTGQGGNENNGEDSGLVLEFNNLEPLVDSMGSFVAETMTKNIQAVVEAVDGNDNSVALEANVDAASFIKDIYFPYTTYSMFFRISDGRYYRVNVALNGEKYCGVLVQRTQPSLGQPYLYVTIIDGSQNQDLVIKSMMEWAKSIYPDGFIVTTQNEAAGY